MRFLEALINLKVNSLDSTYTYHVDDEEMIGQIEFGRRVLVEFGHKQIEAYIVNEEAAPVDTRTRPVLQVLDDEPVIDKQQWKLAQWISEYYCCPLPRVLEAMIPRKANSRKNQDTVATQDSGSSPGEHSGSQEGKNSPAGWLTLNPDQERALAAIKKAAQAGRYDEFLLYGVTGSGKTEIYIRAAQEVLARGRGVIILFPEIALTRHLVSSFSSRLPDLAVLHSRMSPGERYRQWKRLRAGETRVVLGTRSAIFAPLRDPGLIIIDEEQERAYKQEEQPRYHARDVARKRAEIQQALLLQGSATPSLETFYRVLQQKTTVLQLPERAAGSRMPRIYVADMRAEVKAGNTGVVSRLLKEKLTASLQTKQQAILFLNRRGYAPVSVCLECGESSRCPHCSVSLNYHHDVKEYLCHYCGYRVRALTECRSCGSHSLMLTGTGTQKVEEEVRKIFPHASIARLDLDSSRKKGSQEAILSRMKKGEIDILVGTQMVARGLDFPGVGLVGVLEVDSMMNLPDFRAAERCMQLITQAAGRAGRRDAGGEVVLQSFNPDQYVLQMVSHQHYDDFLRRECEWRRTLNYPPFSHLLRVVVAAADEKLACDVAGMISLEINELSDAKEDEVIILGPAPCPLYRIRNRIRYQLFVKSDNPMLLSSIGRALVSGKRINGVKVDVDIDPQATM